MGLGFSLGIMGSAGRGVGYALGAYVLWGVLPLYWKQLQGVSATVILAHRLVWSFVFLVGVVMVRREWRLVVRSMGWRVIGLCGLASGLLAVNWLTYIWAVNADRIVETSLGYFINPLVNVTLGVVFLRERLRLAQWCAVGLAGAGVSWLTWQHGALPWVALVLAGSFALYGLLKKKAPIAPLPGLTLETGALLLPALFVVIGAPMGGEGLGGRAEWRTVVLLIGTGAVTALPLLLFAAAARRVRLSTVGLLQYLAPTCQLLIGVMVYGEPFDRDRLVGFGMIWAALAVYSAAMIRSFGGNAGRLGRDAGG